MITKKDLLSRLERLEKIQEKRFEDCAEMKTKIDKVNNYKSSSFNKSFINFVQETNKRLERIEKAISELIVTKWTEKLEKEKNNKSKEQNNGLQE